MFSDKKLCIIHELMILFDARGTKNNLELIFAPRLRLTAKTALDCFGPSRAKKYLFRSCIALTVPNCGCAAKKFAARNGHWNFALIYTPYILHRMSPLWNQYLSQNTINRSSITFDLKYYTYSYKCSIIGHVCRVNINHHYMIIRI
jgi:hypothetical protein